MASSLGQVAGGGLYELARRAGAPKQARHSAGAFYLSSPGAQALQHTGRADLPFLQLRRVHSATW
jgi:hypothetical protein